MEIFLDCQVAYTELLTQDESQHTGVKAMDLASQYGCSQRQRLLFDVPQKNTSETSSPLISAYPDRVQMKHLLL